MNFGDARIPERVWKKLNQVSGCWEWQGSLGHGYGQVRRGRKYVTPRVNVSRLPADAWERRAAAASRTQTGHTRSRGEDSGMASLSSRDVSFIRAFSEDGIPGVDIARTFGVCKTQVSRIVLRKRWAHQREEWWVVPRDTQTAVDPPRNHADSDD